MAYIRSLSPAGGDGECFLCKYWSSPDRDRPNHVLWRGAGCFVAFNRFPYSNGHLLIAPGRHVPTLAELTDDELNELIRRIRDAQILLTETLRPQGYNVGMNIGRCAGAGLPDHVHAHVVPRWDGDTSFMSVVGDARVIPQDMDELYACCAEAAARVGLPPLAGLS